MGEVSCEKQTLRSSVLLHLAGLFALGAFAWLALESRSAPAVSLRTLLVATAMGWVAIALAWFAAKQATRPTLIVALWLWALLFRAAGFFSHPVLEDDWARYLWDGREFARTGNPYLTTPAQHFTDQTVPPEFQRLLDEINHPQWRTIYAPGCQLAFLASHAIAPAQLWPLKLILIAADLLVLALLLRLIPPRRALLYAWCPLVVQETAFTAHPDILWVAGIIAAIAAYRSGQMTVAAVICGIALATKIFALLLVPFLLIRLAWRDRLTAGAVAIALYLPFWGQGSAADFAGLSVMAADWEFNATLYSFCARCSEPLTAKVITLTAFGAIWLWLLLRWRSDPAQVIPRGDLVLGFFFLLSAVVNPWYLVALAPFVALRPSLWGVAALGVVPLSYAHGLNLNEPTLAPYEHPAWVRPVELGVVLLFAVVGWRRQRRFASAERN